MAITQADDGTVDVPEIVQGADFKRLNRRSKKRPDWWVFAVDRQTHLLPDNSRAIFEAVKDDPEITKIVLTRSRRIELAGTNVVTESLLSPAGQQRLVQSGTVFVESNPRRTLAAPIVAKRQRVVLVRKGLQLEKTGRAMNDPVVPEGPSEPDDLAPRIHRVPAPAVTGLLAASDVDQLAVLATHWPATYENVWRTGIPAHDFLTGDEQTLPVDLRAQLEALRRELGGRRLLLFSPALRRTGTDPAPYEFSESELGALTAWCDEHDYVLGLREHTNDLRRAYAARLESATIDLSHRRFPSLHVVMRAADGMLTDYSGDALDFACTGKPVVSFAHDLDHWRDRLLYDLDHFFPGRVCAAFDELESALDVFVGGTSVPHAERVRDMLVDHRDGRNTERVLARLMAPAEVAGERR
ncbi:CDP-glycerol glycerophosphotransferase family protein [Aeromicrobium sp. UC242_57]|uniref:CDP-glycerol glycerophosphotransferase family protein n=1 Tax=Aeromicrobium sp. UC242_57 TaxID=3374624 RepID=UPI00378AF800